MPWLADLVVAKNVRICEPAPDGHEPATSRLMAPRQPQGWQTPLLLQGRRRRRSRRSRRSRGAQTLPQPRACAARRAPPRWTQCSAGTCAPSAAAHLSCALTHSGDRDAPALQWLLEEMISRGSPVLRQFVCLLEGSGSPGVVVLPPGAIS